MTYAHLKSWLLELIFTPICVGCEAVLGSERKYKCFCGNCFDSIKIQNRFVCVFCASPSSSGATCPFCIKENYLDQLLSTVEYGGLVRKAIKETKYRYIKNIAEDLSGIFSKFILKNIKLGKLDFSGQEVILPVPLARLRLNRRGFNQAMVLVEQVGRATGLKVESGVLVKKFGLLNQADVKIKAERIRNALEKHECAEPEAVRGKVVWLIDDVATTGATLNDCARALKGAGAKRVVGLAFAKGKLRNSVTKY